MIRRPPRSTPTDTRFPYTTLFRSLAGHCGQCIHGGPAQRRKLPIKRLLSLRPCATCRLVPVGCLVGVRFAHLESPLRSEEHTSELQSLMRISYAVFCLKKKKKIIKV